MTACAGLYQFRGRLLAACSICGAPAIAIGRLRRHCARRWQRLEPAKAASVWRMLAALRSPRRCSGISRKRIRAGFRRQPFELASAGFFFEQKLYLLAYNHQNCNSHKGNWKLSHCLPAQFLLDTGLQFYRYYRYYRYYY